MSTKRKTPARSATNPLARAWNVLHGTVTAFLSDDVPRMGAALAYYTTIAVAPLLVLTLLVVGKFFEDADMRNRLIGQISRLASAQLGEAVQAVGTTAERKTEGALTVASLVTLAFGALAVFRHLQDALNKIWKVEAPPDLTWRKKLQRRLSSFGTVAMTGFLLQVSLVASAGLTWLADNAAQIVFLGAEFTRVWKLTDRGRRTFDPKSPLPAELLE